MSAYAREDIDWCETELQRSVEVAPFGENLTVKGLPVSEAVIGEQWTVGSALLQVAQPRLPCFKLELRIDDPRFLKRFAAAGRPAAYPWILREGDIAAGDEIAVHDRTGHAVTSALVSRALLGDHRLTDSPPKRARPRAASATTGNSETGFLAPARRSR